LLDNLPELCPLPKNRQEAQVNIAILQEVLNHLKSLWYQLESNFTVFTFAFETAHLIFAVKYWNLSVKLE
jgi:hypothetical protein